METELYPPPEPGRALIEAPAVRVTLLQDRAEVRRSARLDLPAGIHRFRVADVAPVLQDVSLRAEIASGHGRVADVRVRRALRIRRADRKAPVGAIEDKLRDLAEKVRALNDDRAQGRQRAYGLLQILQHSLAEIPEDVAWGSADVDRWRTTFGALSQRLAALDAAEVAARYEQLEIIDELQAALTEWYSLIRADHAVAAWVELEVAVPERGSVELIIEYVVPNAMWRPSYVASLDGGRVSVVARAAIWQNSGEDWRQVELSCSTARPQGGTEPPYLADDLLQAQRKAEQVAVGVREVAVQSVTAGGVPSGGVDLPGVDDGGDVRAIAALGRHDIVSDGRPHFVALFDFVSEAQVDRVCVPEKLSRVVLRAVVRNTSALPLLAGPVELVRDHGPVGTTTVAFVAPGEVFALGFGPDDDVSVHHLVETPSHKADPTDKWSHRLVQATTWLSNLSGDEKVVVVTERVPVSEIAEVKVDVEEAHTKPAVKPDADGFCRFVVQIPPYGQEKVRLRHRIRTAPGVTG